MTFFPSVFPPGSGDRFFRPKSPHVVQNVPKSDPKDLRKAIPRELRKRFREFLDFDATLSYNCCFHGSRTTKIYEKSLEKRTKKHIQNKTLLLRAFLCKISKNNEKVLPKWTRGRGERTVFFTTFSAPGPPGCPKWTPGVAREPKVLQNVPKVPQIYPKIMKKRFPK